MTVSMYCPVFSEIEDQGGKAAIEREFAGMVVEPEANYHVTISVKLDDVAEADAEKLCEKISVMKNIGIGGAYDHYFTALATGDKSLKDSKMDLRGDTTVYFCPRDDRVIVCMAIDFQEKVDKCVAKVFMQELKTSTKHVNGAPPTN